MRHDERQGPAATMVVPEGIHVASRRHRGRVLAAAALFGVALAAPLPAQSGDGYLFGRPQGSVTIRGGLSRPSTSGDVFADLTDPRRGLTLQRNDFLGASVGMEAALAVTQSLDLSAEVSLLASAPRSHYRDLVDDQDREIEQTTSFRRVPLALNARLYLAPRGRSIGRLAWVPASVVPFVGAGAGMMWYRLRQDGDFVDATDNTTIFPDQFESSGWTPMAQGIAGVDVSLSPRLALTTDLRYLWAKHPDLGGDFRDFSTLDLSGATLSLGLTVRL